MTASRPVKAVLWMAGAMVLTMVLYVGVRLVTDVTLFKIDHIEVRGNVRTSTETMLETLGIFQGQSLYGEKVRELSERAASLPWVKSAKVIRRIPDTVVVDVEEWEPSFLIRLDQLYYLTKEAHVINAPLSMGLDYTIITGFNWARLEAPGFDRDRLVCALDLIAKGAFGDRVSEVHYDPTLGITVYGQGGDKPYGIFFGFGDLEERFGRLGRMRKTLEKRGKYAVSADLSFDDRIVARLVPLTPPEERGGRK